MDCISRKSFPLNEWRQYMHMFYRLKKKRRNFECRYGFRSFRIVYSMYARAYNFFPFFSFYFSTHVRWQSMGINQTIFSMRFGAELYFNLSNPPRVQKNTRNSRFEYTRSAELITLFLRRVEKFTILDCLNFVCVCVCYGLFVQPFPILRVCGSFCTCESMIYVYIYIHIRMFCTILRFRK